MLYEVITDAVGIKKHMNLPFLQLTDHLRQSFIEERLADAMQHNPLQVRQLVGDHDHFFRQEIPIRLPAAAILDAGLAAQITAIRRFQIEGFRQVWFSYNFV